MAENVPEKQEKDTGGHYCQLTDAGKYAFAGLAANILAELYERDEERYRRLKFEFAK